MKRRHAAGSGVGGDGSVHALLFRGGSVRQSRGRHKS